MLGLLLLLVLPCAARYDEQQAALYLQYARASFCDEGAIVSWRCGDMCEEAPVLPGSVRLLGPGTHSGVLGYVARLDSSRCVLAFRGSVNAQNWEVDAALTLTDWPPGAPSLWCHGCQVHSGFALAYQELRAEVWKAVDGCEGIDVTGHSLGAGVGTVAAMDLRGYGAHVSSLWTFGSPRVGNPEFVEAFMNASLLQHAPVPSFRVVHFHDPVPHGGPSAFYTHIPGEIYYADRASTAYDVCGWTPDRPENESCGSGTLSTLDVLDGLASGDHVDYMNRTLQLKYMNFKCRPTNSCWREGFVSTSRLALVTTTVGLAAFAAGMLCMAATQRCRRRRTVRLAEPLSENIHLSRMA